MKPHTKPSAALDGGSSVLLTILAQCPAAVGAFVCVYSSALFWWVGRQQHNEMRSAYG
jgi:hypothetical protein